MAESESFSSEEFAETFPWVSKTHWEHWNYEIAADSRARKLDFLAREARDEKAVGALRDLAWHFAELPLITTGQRFPLPLESQHHQNNRAGHANPDDHNQRYFPMR
jgi:hypothetical protein